jgi:hypothetical protein
MQHGYSCPQTSPTPSPPPPCGAQVHTAVPYPLPCCRMACHHRGHTCAVFGCDGLQAAQLWDVVCALGKPHCTQVITAGPECIPLLPSQRIAFGLYLDTSYCTHRRHRACAAWPRDAVCKGIQVLQISPSPLPCSQVGRLSRFVGYNLRKRFICTVLGR